MSINKSIDRTQFIGYGNTFKVVQQRLYAYQPQPDITTYELAFLLPLFSALDTTLRGRVVPPRNIFQGACVGFPVGSTLLQLDSDEEKRLGSAMRHLVAR